MIHAPAFWIGLTCGVFGPWVVIVAVMLVWKAFWAATVAYRDARKWIPLPLKNGHANWRKLYLIPRLFLDFWWVQFTSQYDHEFSPTE
jgi:hypothetical protein